MWKGDKQRENKRERNKTQKDNKRNESKQKRKIATVWVFSQQAPFYASISLFTANSRHWVFNSKHGLR